MAESTQMECLFRFNGSYEDFVQILVTLLYEVDYEGHPFRFEEVPVGLTYTLDIWVQDPDGENPYSQLGRDGRAYEAVCGLFLASKGDGYDVLLSPEALNSGRDKWGSPRSPVTKLTENTSNREAKEKRFIESLRTKVIALC